jgi:hypothetical protein
VVQELDRSIIRKLFFTCIAKKNYLEPYALILNTKSVYNIFGDGSKLPSNNLFYYLIISKLKKKSNYEKIKILNKIRLGN